MVSVVGAAAAAAVGHHARHTAPYSPVLEQVDICLPQGVDAPARLRIGFVADTHIGSVIRASDVERALSLLLTAAPDVLLFGGDYISESPRHIPYAAAVLGSAASTARLGSFAVLGNHDYANGADRLTGQLEKRGIRVLRNEPARIADDSGELWIAGIDDVMLGSPDVQRAFAGVPENTRALALWHEPDWAESVVPYGAFLQLSGHSHGGQIQLPVMGSIAAPAGGRRFVSGLNHAMGMPVYTSRGVGVFRPPVRFRCAPEVTLITLV
ncbi:MAG: metallophosphoesterase [Chloroflexi bacterium]|nr:metallophosphoesterase [Chloroflexota bacterium]